ncbi:MAG: ATP-binding domain-containing protein [Chloroflexi bacterium]|nr:ATP-binding domain-containing protein [Chloroflexota bacterium]
MANEELPSIWRLRETQALVNWLRHRNTGLIRSADLHRWVRNQEHGPWIELLEGAVEDHEVETGNGEVLVDTYIEWLAEWARDARRRQRGLLLLTAHRAKGLEFDHVIVLDGAWNRIGRDEDPDARRRLYYVAMTRARQTLALGRLGNQNPMQPALRDNPAVIWREPATLPPPPTETTRRYRQLSLKDVYLSFAGTKPSEYQVHRAIADLSPNDPLTVRQQSGRWELRDQAGVVVGTLAQSFQPPKDMACTSANVLAVATWKRSYSDPQYQHQLHCDTWEVVVPELIFEPS